MRQNELLRLMIHDIKISESTKEPIVTLEIYFQDDDGNWTGGGPVTMAIGNTWSLFAEAIAYPVPWKDGNGEREA